jgi:hypothetical protein
MMPITFGTRCRGPFAYYPPPLLAVEILTGMDRIDNSPRVFASFSAAHAKTRLDEVLAE